MGKSFIYTIKTLQWKTVQNWTNKEGESTENQTFMHTQGVLGHEFQVWCSDFNHV